jgi:hypothetical protein
MVERTVPLSKKCYLKIHFKITINNSLKHKDAKIVTSECVFTLIVFEIVLKRNCKMSQIRRQQNRLAMVVEDERSSEQGNISRNLNLIQCPPLNRITDNTISRLM